MTPVDASMREYAVLKTRALLDEAVVAMHNAAKLPDESAVHKMRVSIRRFQQAIRLFAQYLRPGGVEKVKKQMRAVMESAGELRNRDIAMALVSDAGGDTTLLMEQRLAYKQELDDKLKRYAKRDVAVLWREKLGLDDV